MKRLLLFCMCLFLCPSAGNAGAYDYTDTVPNVTDAVLTAWGRPKINKDFIQDKSDEYFAPNGFKIKGPGKVCCGDIEYNRESQNYGGPVWKAGYGDGKKGDHGIIAMIARKNIAEHGAEFCLTQIHANSSSGTFYIQYQQPNWPGLSCAWFCEPGWDGVECKEKSNVNHSCNTTNYASEINAKRSQSLYGPRINDAIKMQYGRIGVAENIAVFDSAAIAERFWHQIVLGAIEFKDHGIVVTPMILGAIGDKDYGNINGQKASGGMKKTLCAQGYTNGDDCRVSSNQCGVEKFCAAYEAKFNKNKHKKVPNGLCSAFVCKDGSQGLDENMDCVQCDEPSVKNGVCNVIGDNMGKCIKCDIGKYFDETDCLCKEADVLNQNQMKYGTHEGDTADKQCWTMTAPKDFVECMLGNTASTTSSAE